MTRSATPPAAPGAAASFGLAGLKSGVVHFLSGKSVSALAGLAVTVLVARRLATPEYAAYVVLLGVVYILGCGTSLGLVEAMQRYLPDLCIRNQRSQAMRVMLRILGLRILATLPPLAALHLAAPALAGLWDLDAYAWAVLLAGPMFLAVTLFTFIAQALETIMLQRQVKWLWVLVSGLRLGIMAALAAEHALDLHAVLLAEIAAFGMGVGLGLVFLAYTVRRDRAGEAAPLPPGLARRMARFAGLNYLMGLAAMFQTSALNRLVAAKILPVAALAEFGFVQNLADTVSRYMPHTLLLNTVRPVLMARFASSRDTVALNRHANLFLKLNLFLLAPAAVLVALCDGPLAAGISGGRYGDDSWLLLGLTWLLAQFCHYRRLEIQAHATEHSGLLLASNLLVVAALVPAALLAMRIGAWGILIGVSAGCLGRDALLMLRLARNGIATALDLPGLLRLLATAGTAYLLLLPLVPRQAGLAAVAGLGLGSGILFLAAALVFKPFNADERDLVNSLFGRRVFRW